jgi:hypothetical protein
MRLNASGRADHWRTIDTVLMGRKTYEVALHSGQGDGGYPGVKAYVESAPPEGTRGLTWDTAGPQDIGKGVSNKTVRSVPFCYSPLGTGRPFPEPQGDGPALLRAETIELPESSAGGSGVAPQEPVWLIFGPGGQR